MYKNYFEKFGVSHEEAEKRCGEIFETIFYGSEDEKFYHPAGSDMGYMEDTGNHDARTEGMSYGMMMCVQMNRKEEDIFKTALATDARLRFYAFILTYMLRKQKSG